MYIATYEARILVSLGGSLAYPTYNYFANNIYFISIYEDPDATTKEE